LDKNMTSCAIWQMNDECSRNPEMMQVECPATCGVCTNVCEDKEADCQNWATDGQCETNPEAMLPLCPQSCGVCQELENFYKIAIDGPPKDEL